MIIRFFFISFLLLKFVPATHCQEQALFLFTCEKDRAGYKVSQPKLLSDFIPDGAFSDPHFINHDWLLIIHSHEKMSDVYQMNLESRTIMRLTGTPEIEYCPQKNPGEASFSCVIGDTVQFTGSSLWAYPEDLKNGGREIYSHLQPILSYSWLNDSLIAAVVGEDLLELHLINVNTLSSKLISTQVNTCVKKDESGNLLFLNQYGALHWFVKKVNATTGKIEIIKKGPERADVLEILDNGNIIMGAQHRLFALHKESNDWVEIADLSQWGIHKIIQMAYNGSDKLALTVLLDH